MRLSREDLARRAAATGYQLEVLEKVLWLLELLGAISKHPFLKGRVALKGGTALNLFVFDVPRLSVDIDLNYIGSEVRETMLAERPKIEHAVQAVCGRLDLGVIRMPDEHAGGKWRLRYSGVNGQPGSLELDLNFVLRTPLWPAVRQSSRDVAGFSVQGIPVLDVHELAAGKLAAMFSRCAGRDLFDVWKLQSSQKLDVERLRLAFVVYGGVNRRDWRKVSLADLRADPDELGRQLVPMLRSADVRERQSLAQWTDDVLHACRTFVSNLLPFTSNEMKFLTALNGHGELMPELLTSNSRLQTVLRVHPGLLWKARNVREHRGGT